MMLYSQILIQLQPFLKDVGDTKIDEHSRESYHTEFQELEEKFARQFYFQQYRFQHFFLPYAAKLAVFQEI